MKIGVFDSGLGGLIITRSFIKELGKYDYLYLGDTKNLPYGEKKPSEILMMTIKGIEFLIKNDCKIIIIACNTATCVALRYIQQIYIPRYYPKIKVLGVVVPTVEEAIESSKKRIGVVATNSTVNSHIYDTEIKKINPDIEVQEVASSGLVPAIESNDFSLADELVAQYVKNFRNIDSLILGCTHYPILKDVFKKHLQESVHIISQDNFMGRKLKEYLQKHKEIEIILSKNSHYEFMVTKFDEHNESVAKKIMPEIKISEVLI